MALHEIIKERETKERILLVIVEFKKHKTSWTSHDMLDEMTELVSACGGHVIDSVIVRVDYATAGLLISEGKAKDIAALCSMRKVDTVIFSQDLKGSQIRNIEEILKVKTIDRTQLILDIFARHANSSEGKMQVELAQLEYLLPRLVGHGAEMSRLGGGIGTVGPGESKLEIDRRRIAQRISKLKQGLKAVSQTRMVKRKKRAIEGVPTVSLVGYTNAGKSTLLNALTDAGQVTNDGLFTTLDSLSRQYLLPNHQKIVLSDTVGFMHELPHHLIESFKATLEEVKDSDLLLHVIDVSNPNFRKFYEAVNVVLQQLDAHKKPVITVLNKLDRVDDKRMFRDLKDNFPNAVLVSALKKEHFDELNDMITQMLSTLIIEIDVTIPIGRMDLINKAHQEGQVFSVKYYTDTINLRAAVSPKLAGMLKKISCS